MPRNRSRSGGPEKRPARSPVPAHAAGLPPGLAARDRACGLMLARARAFPELAGDQLDETGLSARDAALAHVIADSATRYWLTLTHVLDAFLSTPLAELEPAMRSVLLCGAAQVMLLDRVPVHAAIDTSVEWAKRAIRPGAAGMVNAVLRRVAGLAAASTSTQRTKRATWERARDEIPLPDGTALVLSHPVLPEAAHDRLSVASSHPRWLISRWIAEFGEGHAAHFAHHDLASPPVILNTSHARERLPESNYLIAHARAGHAVVGGPREWLIGLLKSRTDVWVQDPSSSLAVMAAAHLSPAAVLDLCAGQGTKTRQLAATFTKARIVACDPDAGRSAILRETFEGSEQVTVGTPDQVRSAWSGKADLVLLDVPCSNTGVLARRVEAKYRCGPAQLNRLVAIQRGIMENAVQMLAPGGRILYSTCSLEPEENDGVVEAAERHGLRVESRTLTTPVGRPGESASEYRDGSYSALLTRAP